MIPNFNAIPGQRFNGGKLFDKGVKVREVAVGTLSADQERIDLASPDTTAALSASPSSWSADTLIYTVPSSYRYLAYYIIVSLDPLWYNAGAYYADFKLSRRPVGGAANGDDDVIVGRSGFAMARSITYPAGQEFETGESVYLAFRNIWNATIPLNYYIHGILERI